LYNNRICKIKRELKNYVTYDKIITVNWIYGVVKQVVLLIMIPNIIRRKRI